MEIQPLQRQIRAADLPLDKLAGNRQIPESDKVAELSKQFEAVLLRQILSDAQKPVFRSTINQDSASKAIYRDMLTNQMAEAISRGNSFGFNTTLGSQLSSNASAGGSPSPAEWTD